MILYNRQQSSSHLITLVNENRQVLSIPQFKTIVNENKIKVFIDCLLTGCLVMAIMGTWLAIKQPLTLTRKLNHGTANRHHFATDRPV